MKNNLLPLSLLVGVAISFPALATTGTVTKTATAPTISILSNGQGPVGLTGLLIQNADFPSGVAGKTKKLTLVSYSAAAYPAAITDTVQLCYFIPYAASPTACITVTPGSSSTTTAFNNYSFSYGSEFQFRHTVTGSNGDQLKPSRQESVTVQYSY